MTVVSTVDRASTLLKEINLLYGAVSGVMLKYSFGWSSETKPYDTVRSWLALVLAIGSVAFSSVLLVLMGDVALDSLRADGDVEPTLVTFDLVTLVVVGLAAVSVVAIIKALVHLVDIRNPS